MTTEELAELFLASLYDMAESAPHPYFLFSMNEFVPKMGISDMAELRKALSLLEEKGLVYLASTDVWGGVSAGITMEGSVFVEKGGETGIIERFRKDPSSIGIVPQSAPSPAPAQTVPEPSVPPEPPSCSLRSLTLQRACWMRFCRKWQRPSRMKSVWSLPPGGTC